LTEHGIVERQRYSDHPPRDRYLLTEAGLAFIPVLLALTAWGDRYATPEGGPPVVFEHSACGHRFTPTVSCDACGERIEPGAVVTRPGAGGRIGPGTRPFAKVISGRT